MEPILLVGASVRAAAFSALRSGLQPWAIDLFADSDLCTICPAQAVSPNGYPDRLPALARDAPPGPWMYTGALENRPDIIEQISQDRPLWGNNAACLRRVRDPFALAAAFLAAGVPHPAVCRSGQEPRGNWLIKPLASGGGNGIRFKRSTGVRNLARRVYLQEYVVGLPAAGVFVAGREGCRLLGVTWQLVGETWLHAAPFRYAGSIGPLPLTITGRTAWERLGLVVTEFAGLRGLFGIDAIIRDGVPWPVEVNPRYTASVEVLEYATGLHAVEVHRQEFLPANRETQAVIVPARRRVVGKAVWFAPRPLTVPNNGPWDDVLRLPPALDEPPVFADIPAVRQRIAAGQPALTAFATGATFTDCESRLRNMARELDRLLLE